MQRQLISYHEALVSTLELEVMRLYIYTCSYKLEIVGSGAR